jgi:hypothetical protein
VTCPGPSIAMATSIAPAPAHVRPSREPELSKIGLVDETQAPGDDAAPRAAGARRRIEPCWEAPPRQFLARLAHTPRGSRRAPGRPG